MLKGFFNQTKEQFRAKGKGAVAVYLVLRILVIQAIVVSVFRRNWENVFVCALTLILFLVPSILENKLKFDFPDTMEIIIILFIFAAEILGEMNSFYIRLHWWDTMLHTLNGFLCAAVGFGLVDILNRNPKVKFQLSPIYLAVVAFCFSMTVGVLWEFFEFGADQLVHTDMQKDSTYNYISSTMLDETKSNKAVKIKDIGHVILVLENGEQVDLFQYGIQGYLDVGIADTMKDLFVNFVGAVVFAPIGYFYVQQWGKGKFAARFIPRKFAE